MTTCYLAPYLLALASFLIPLSSHAQSVQLVFSSFLGGTDGDGGLNVAVDDHGYVYAMGISQSIDFPITAGVYNPYPRSSGKIFVTKFDPSGATLIYSTFLDGSGHENPTGFQVDKTGNTYICGITGSVGYTRTPGSYFSDEYFDMRESIDRFFLTKLNPTGSALVYSIVFGDKNNIQNIRSIRKNFLGLDGENHAYIVGDAHYAEIETTAGALQTQPPDSMAVCSRPFIYKFSQDGSKLEYGTFFGGPTIGPYITDFTVDVTGNVYLTGGVRSDDFPITEKLFTQNRPYSFLSKIDPSGAGTVYTVTFPMGGLKIAVDDSENIYLRSNAAEKEFPVTPGAYSSRNMDGGPGLCKFSSDGKTLLFSTRMFSLDDFGEFLIGIDSLGRIYLTGNTIGKSILPTTPDAYDGNFNGGNNDIYFCVFDAAGSKLLYATYFGGSGEDYCSDLKVTGSGEVYLTGFTTSRDFPTTEGALSRTLKGGSDSFICKFSFDSTPTQVEDTPRAFHLFPAHPNPFNPSTSISFTLPQSGKAELAVYSITGQRVRTLLSGPVSAGSHSVVWDGRDDSGQPVSSGVYLSRLTSGKQTATGRMVLVK